MTGHYGDGSFQAIDCTGQGLEGKDTNLWSKDKDLWSEDKNKDLQNGPRGS